MEFFLSYCLREGAIASLHFRPWPIETCLLRPPPRANELLDLSSGDGRESQLQQQQQQQQQEDGSCAFIPQILMNPWDPQQPPVMTLAPIANAMQQYQQQWLSQYQQVRLTGIPYWFSRIRIKIIMIRIRRKILLTRLRIQILL